MKCVVQRVKSASVTVDGKVVGSIGPGICALVGASRTARPEDAAWLATKLSRLRIFDDENGKGWARGLDVLPTHGLLLVSQFTLCHKPMTGGNKPDLHDAMTTRLAHPFFNAFVELCKTTLSPDRVATGSFGEMMEVNIVNDGPITLVVETPSGAPALKQPLQKCFVEYKAALAAAEAAAAAQSPTTAASPSAASPDSSADAGAAAASPTGGADPSSAPPGGAGGDGSRGA